MSPGGMMRVKKIEENDTVLDIFTPPSAEKEKPIMAAKECIVIPWAREPEISLEDHAAYLASHKWVKSGEYYKCELCGIYAKDQGGDYVKHAKTAL